jgi:hypothetical protein
MRWNLVLLILVLIGSVFVYGYSPSVAQSINPLPEFNKIYHTPYNEQTYNCLNKSVDFATYLKNNNQTNIEYVNIAYKTGVYSHQFVLWNGQVYDPTDDEYNVSEIKYINWLESDGFTGVIFTSPV